MTYGYTFAKDTRAITGEQDVLRYSALDLWLRSKDVYRKRYYEGASIVTAETVFGHNIHKAIERGEVVIDGLPRYSKPEHDIIITTGGVKIGGCLDSFEPDTCSFLDYKTSHLTKFGDIPWDAVRVAKHMQLVFYSLLVKLANGKVDPWTKLVWIETQFGKDSREFAGHVLESDSRELSLTGKFVVFPRRIPEWERAALLKVIKKSALEISEDFIRYKKLHE